MTAIYVWIPAAAIPMLGKFIPGMSLLADLGWILGFILGFGMYSYAMRNETASLLSAEENKSITIVETVSIKKTGAEM